MIVWFPDDFEPPSEEVCDWLNTWLEADFGRTLIYVGRDYDAAPGYWENIRPAGSNELADEYARRLADARSEFRNARKVPTGPLECDWFTIDPTLKRRRIETLTADTEWTSGIDAASVQIELNGRLIPPDDAETLLESEGDVLVSRQWLGRGQLIVVVNGSFLLNVPLVNHENRQLARRLIEEVGPGPKHVVFLESGPGGPTILDRDPDVSPPTGLDFYGVPPLDRIFFQLALLGLIFCFTRLPIFGIPREDTSTFESDFGQHVAALGELLERSGDVAYAKHQIENHRSQSPIRGALFRRSGGSYEEIRAFLRCRSKVVGSTRSRQPAGMRLPYSGRDRPE